MNSRPQGQDKSFVSSQEQLQKIQKELTHCRETYQAVVESATELMSRFLPDTTLTFVNEEYCRYFRKSREELIGRSFLFYRSAADRTELLEKLQRLTVDNPVMMHEGAVKLPWCREERWQHWSNKAIFDEAGNIIEIQGVGRDITEKKKIELALQQSERKLKKEKKKLESKNIALREVMKQVEIETKLIQDDVVSNVENILLPILQKMEVAAPGTEKSYLPLIEKTLNDLAGSFGRTITDPALKMTPREVQIANMIKSGLSTKEIAALLNLSSHTVETHRNNIRRKLRINNKDVNLFIFLQNV